MGDESFEALAAFLDNEPADPEEVARLLAGPEGQAALLDFALLKAAMQQDRTRPRRQFTASLEQRLAGRRGGWRRMLAAPRAAVAAAFLLTALAGFWLGTSTGSRAREDAGPPASARVVHFERGVDWHSASEQEGR